MQTPHQTSSKPTTLTTEDRLAAMEIFLQQLVLVLEAEPRFTADKTSAWLRTCTEHMRQHQSATPAQITALQQLADRVLA